MQLLISLVGTTTIFEVTTFTNYAYSHEIVTDTLYKRTRSGRLYTYSINSEFHKFSIPLINLNSATASTFNEWWENQSVLNFTENSSTDALNTAFSCKVVNTTKPLDSFLDANFGAGLFRGTLLLETI